MTDYEQAYRALREEMDRLAEVLAERNTTIARVEALAAKCAGCSEARRFRATFAARQIRALLAPSPAEGTGEAGQVRIPLRWVDEVVIALDSASIIGARSCRPGDGLHIANHDRLIREAQQWSVYAESAKSLPTPVSSGEAVALPVIHVWGFGDVSGVGASIDTGTITDVANGILDKTESFGHEVQRSTVRTLGEGVLREAHAVVRIRPDAEPMWHRFFHPGDSWPRALAPVVTPNAEDGQP